MRRKGELLVRKLIIQIPCWNEELNIADTIHSLPRFILGVDAIEVLIIDDGSSDQTVAKAREAGIDHLVQFSEHRGLAAAFQAGINQAISLGASIIVNTDADNQYMGSEIEKLLQPILLKDADLVIGDRRASKLVFLPYWKKILHRLADWVVSLLVENHAPDPTSGFRAMAVSFAKEINLKDTHSYTVETLIQAYYSGRNVWFVPVDTALVNRPSRLIKNLGVYIFKSAKSLIRSSVVYGFRNYSEYYLERRSLILKRGLKLVGKVNTEFATERIEVLNTTNL